jgi:UDP-2-acetamido-3-amino-2,3-dideoxy-glucuronate N-acetyltransferase
MIRKMEIKAVIFDMDGLLVDTEPLWEQAQTKIFGQLGIKVTVELCQPLKGVKIDEAIEYWYNIKPWKNKTHEQVKKELLDEVEHLMQEAKIMPGVYEVIDYYTQKKIPIAIASSSYMRLIKTIVRKLGLTEKIKVLHSSEFEKAGKPSPDIFLTTARKMNIETKNCLVFEDSVNGVIAAKRAGMKVVAVPTAKNFHNPAFKIADFKVSSLLEWQKILTKNHKKTYKKMNEKEYFVHPTAIIDEGAKIGKGTKIWHFCHIMGNSEIGENCSLGQNVFVANDVKLGKNVKVQNNVSIYTGVICEDDVFLGPSMVFTNVSNPRSAVVRKGQYEQTIVKKGASIGANATIVCGHTIGEYAFIGAGTVVTKDVPAFALMVGTPARQLGWMSRFGHRLNFDKNNIAICPESGEKYELLDGKIRIVQ